MNANMQPQAGSLAYIWPPGVAAGFTYLIIDRGWNLLLIGVAVALSYMFFLAYSKFRGVAPRFNAAQALLLLVVFVGAFVVWFGLFGPVDGLAEGFASMSKPGNEAREWVFSIGAAVLVVAFIVLSVLCAWQSSRRGGIFALPIIGRWAWQSATYDDTSGEYAPLDEASKGYYVRDEEDEI